MSQFREKVITFISSIPKGKVVNYGQVAAAAGSPRSARQVGGVLMRLDSKQYNHVPWWRVINNQGILSIKGNWTATKELQRDLLVAEGVVVKEDFTLDIEKYRWKTQ